VCRATLLDLTICCLLHLSICLPRLAYLKLRMSGERTELEKFVAKVLKNFIVDKAMFEGVQASLIRGLRLPL
jgi:hypothetical protein